MRKFALGTYLGLLIFTGTGVAYAGETASDTTILFDIPAQPLTSALDAYSTRTGIEVFYNAALAAQHQSSAVVGMMTVGAALAALLRGTGYVSKTTGPGIISIVPAPPGPPADPPIPNFNAFQPYFAVLQARLAQTLCNSDRSTPRSSRIVLKFWLTVFGKITHAELITVGTDPAQNSSIINKLEGLDIGVPPPADLPQPVMMAIYPPPPGGALGCSQ